MELKDILIGSRITLSNVTFKNKHNFDDEENVKIATQDYLNNFVVNNREHNIRGTYRRHLFSENQAIDVLIEFEFISKVKDEYDLDADNNKAELISLIEQNKDEFLLFAPADASLTISNLFKSANFPPLITQPSFID